MMNCMVNNEAQIHHNRQLEHTPEVDDLYQLLTRKRLQLIEARPEVLAFDFTVWSEKYRYAGTVDLYCRINGIPWIVDFKVSPNIYPSYELQVSAYKFANASFPPNTRLAILQLGYEKNKKQKYKFTRVKSQFSLFMATYRIWKNECGEARPYQREYPISLTLNGLPETLAQGRGPATAAGKDS